MTPEQKIHAAISLIAEYHDVDGSHHKQWLIAKVTRILVGEEEWAEEWAGEMDEGVAP